MRVSVGLSRGLMVAAIVAGCAGGGPTPSPAAPRSSVVAPTTAAFAPVTVRDDAGRSVTFAEAPRRIVSVAPSATELAFAAGLGNAVVAVDKFSNYPPEAASRPSLGSYTRPDLEGLLAAKPDVVLVTDVHLAELVPTLGARGIRLLVLSAKDVEGVLADLELLGAIADHRAMVSSLVAALRARIAAVAARVAGRTPLGVFYELDPTLFTAGPGTVIDDVIRRAGGRNVAGGSTTAYPQLSAEEVIAANPALIILADSAAGVTPAAVAARPGWASVRAVATGRVVVMDADIASRPGPRVVDALEQIAGALFPTP